MKMLQINAVNIIGSTGRSTSEINNYLNKNGYTGSIAYAYGINEKNSYIIGNSLDRKIHGFLSRILGLQGYFSLLSTKKLISYIKEFKPDVVRLGNLHSNYINIPYLTKFLAKNDIATILTLDDCFYYTGKCMHYTSQKCYKWKEKCGKCPRIKNDNPSWLFDFTKKMLIDKEKNFNSIPRLAVVGVSKWITNEAKNSILSNADYITTIYNWIDLDVFKFKNNVDLGISELKNKFIILGVATEWSDLKGLNTFIELSKFLEEDEVIVLIGKLNNKIRLPKNIINIKQTNNVEKLVEFYSKANVFLQLSKEETFGKVVAESLACGTPVITINSTANAELVGKNCGFILERRSVKEIINSIKKIKNNKKDYYSKFCRNFAEKSFDKNTNISKYIELSKKLIQLKGEKYDLFN